MWIASSIGVGLRRRGLLWIASSIRRGWIASSIRRGLRRRDTYACVMLFMRIASCVFSLTRALLQIHCGFTTIFCLGSGQGGGCWFMTSVVYLTFASLERDRCLL